MSAREGSERRVRERRLTGGGAIDVSRLEYENLFRQVDEVLRRITRIELALHHLDARIETLESDGGRPHRATR
jgi:hypothetical protein